MPRLSYRLLVTCLPILLHPDSRYLFAFAFKGRRLAWTRLPQGYVESIDSIRCSSETQSAGFALLWWKYSAAVH